MVWSTEMKGQIKTRQIQKYIIQNIRKGWIPIDHQVEENIVLYEIY